MGMPIMRLRKRDTCLCTQRVSGSVINGQYCTDCRSCCMITLSAGRAIQATPASDNPLMFPGSSVPASFIVVSHLSLLPLLRHQVAPVNWSNGKHQYHAGFGLSMQSVCRVANHR